MKKTFLIFLLSCLTILGWGQERIAITHGPYLQNLSEKEVTIVWTANKPSVGWAELAPNDGTVFYYQRRPQYFDAVNGVKNTSTIHTVKITGLTPGTRYRYRVYAEEVLNHQGNEVTYGRTAATNAYTARPLAFTTNDRHKSSVSFAVLNDIHERTADIPVLLNNADYSKRDMIIYNGDMVSSFDSEDQIFKYFMDESVKLFAGRQPLYYARGNHETRGVFATSFQKYFCPQEPHLYFTVRQGPACFVFLDTGEDKPDNDIEYSGITDYDNYRTEQAHWLAGVLQSKDYTEAKFKIIVCHMPPVDEEPIWHGQAEVLNKFVPLLNKAHVTVMLCGHLHFYLYKAPSKEINFPIIVNSLDTVLSGTAEGKTLDIEIKNKAGNTIEKKSYTVD